MKQKCVVCGNPLRFSGWTDRYGEAECAYCGAPYQVLPIGNLTEEDLPYCKLNEEGVYWLRKYYKETGKRVPFGTYLHPEEHPDKMKAIEEFDEWVEKVKGRK